LYCSATFAILVCDYCVSTLTIIVFLTYATLISYALSTDTGDRSVGMLIAERFKTIKEAGMLGNIISKRQENETVIDKFNYQMTPKKLKCLLDDGWLNDEV